MDPSGLVRYRMFLYLTSAANLRLSRHDIPQFLPGEITVIRRRQAALLWIADEFTHAFERRGHLVIEVRRPLIDRQAVIHLSWNLASGEVTLERRWSGEFTAYMARKPGWILASHLRLLAWVCCGLPPGVRPLLAGYKVRIADEQTLEPRIMHMVDNARTDNSQYEYAETVARVRKLVCASVRGISGPGALLLSGGIDSSVIAAVGKLEGKKIFPFVFGLKETIRERKRAEDDLFHARRVTIHLGLKLEEILLEPRQLIANVPTAVALSETSRGTIVDDCVALMEVARILAKKGYTTVWTGECADDLFGGFKFALRYYRGARLKQYYRRELSVSLPDELCILQKIFEPWGISVVHPFWIPELKSLGQNLPLGFRLDSRRLMKRVLRDAFSDILPIEICERPKGITRDTTQIRFVLEGRFGTSRERYRPTFHKIFRDGFRWPTKRRNSVQKK
jgi:asparagine synthetase B (glutamine-hydrolysing)